MPDHAAAPPQMTLEQALVEAGVLTADEIEAASAEAGRLQRRLTDHLAEESLVTPEDLAMALSLQLNMPVADLKRHTVHPDAIALVPEEYARRHDLIPVDVAGGALVVAMADPGNIEVLDDLRAQARMAVQPAVGIRGEIREAISRNYRAGGEIDTQVSHVVPVATAPEAQQGLAPDLVAQTPIARTVDLLIAQAVRDRASDIHFEPQAQHLRIRYRIDGVLHEAQTLPMGVHPQLITRIKVLAGMNIAERRRPQDGQFSVQVDGKEVDFRVATSDSAHGELMVLRVLDKSVALLALRDLGFQPEPLERYSRMLGAPFGMILVGGPTGSGKTTTLYASVNHLDRKTRNVITIEDPIEYLFPDINQIGVNPRADITFASGLRSIMRLDPDVILVGEVRDGETAGMTARAALTGHLVLSSIHANDAVGVLFRLMDLGVERFLIASGLVGLVSQRMVRTVCRHCRRLSEAADTDRLAYEHELGESRDEFHVGSGCNFCAQTGYLGRTGVFEVLAFDEELRRMLLAGASSEDLRARAIDQGMITMQRDGMLKVKQGITTPHEVITAVFSVG